MNLIIILLLMIAVLAIAIRIAESRRTLGAVILGVVALLLLSVPVSLLLLMIDRQAHRQRVIPATTQAVARDIHASGVRAEAADEAEASESEELDASNPPSEAGEAAEPASADTLSVDIATETGEVIIPPRPEWVEADEVRTGQIHTTAVSSGPHETERECRKALDRELESAVRDYIDWYLGSAYDERFHASEFVRYDPDQIKQRLVPTGKIYHEVIRVSFGPMHQMHAQLVFDPAFRQELDGKRAELDRRWQEWIVTGRLLGTALGLGVLLGAMVIFFGYFRLDTATRGFYSGRLQWTAAVAILALLAVSAVLAGRILQM